MFKKRRDAELKKDELIFQEEFFFFFYLKNKKAGKNLKERV